MLTRKEAIERILRIENIQNEDIIISSTGMTSRELYYVKDRLLNFYVMGSLGISLSIALGIALNSNKKVVTILGDGDSLMELGTFVTANRFQLLNLRIYILDNESHASTGGQKTDSEFCSYPYETNQEYFRFNIEKGKGNAGRIPLSGKQIKERFLEALK